MPIAQIEILAGRTAADRQKLIAQVTAAIVTSMGVNAACLRIVLTEAHPKLAGRRGAEAAALGRTWGQDVSTRRTWPERQ